MFGVPFDYCLRLAEQENAACMRDPGELLETEGVFLRYTSRFDRALESPPDGIEANQPLVSSLVLRESGETSLEFIDGASLEVSVTAELPFLLDLSANRQTLTVVPESS